MTQTDLFNALVSLGMPVAYGQFIGTPKNPVPAPPFICYQFTDDADFKADNQNYIEISNFQIELYTPKKDLTKEQLVQDKLKELRLPYSKLEAWLDTEKMWQILYKIQIMRG